MQSSNEFPAKVACAVALLLVGNLSFAGSVVVYDDVNFVTYQSGDDIYGYYRARDEQFSCEFLFIANTGVGSKDADGVEVLKVKTFDFVPHKHAFSYAQRDPRASIDGVLYTSKDGVVLKTDRPHGGCMSAAGGFDALPGTRGAAQFEPVKRLDAIGIGVVIRKSFFYQQAGKGKQQQYVVPGDPVAVLDRHGDYSHVRFVNEDMNVDDGDPKKITIGWIRSMDIADPFPHPVKKELQ